MNPSVEFKEFVRRLGLGAGLHVVVHSSFRRVRQAFPGLTIREMVGVLQDLVVPRGSLIMPAFTYCFKRTDGPTTVFVKDTTASVVGSVSEVFRCMPGVIRTSSPTHSFSLWGRVADEIGPENCPHNPLGDGSVMEWVARRPDAFALMLGVDFSSLSFCHYIEGKAPVPWAEFSPWPKCDFLNIGVSENGEISLNEVPRCSRSFTAFEDHLLSEKTISRVMKGTLSAEFIPFVTLLEYGIRFFRLNPGRLLCPTGNCDVCDARRERYRAELRSAE